MTAKANFRGKESGRRRDRSRQTNADLLHCVAWGAGVQKNKDRKSESDRRREGLS